MTNLEAGRVLIPSDSGVTAAADHPPTLRSVTLHDIWKERQSNVGSIESCTEHISQRGHSSPSSSSPASSSSSSRGKTHLRSNSSSPSRFLDTGPLPRLATGGGKQQQQHSQRLPTTTTSRDSHNAASFATSSTLGDTEKRSYGVVAGGGGVNGVGTGTDHPDGDRVSGFLSVNGGGSLPHASPNLSDRNGGLTSYSLASGGGDVREQPRNHSEGRSLSVKKRSLTCDDDVPDNQKSPRRSDSRQHPLPSSSSSPLYPNLFPPLSKQARLESDRGRSALMDTEDSYQSDKSDKLVETEDAEDSLHSLVDSLSDECQNEGDADQNCVNPRQEPAREGQDGVVKSAIKWIWKTFF